METVDKVSNFMCIRIIQGACENAGSDSGDLTGPRNLHLKLPCDAWSMGTKF